MLDTPTWLWIAGTAISVFVTWYVTHRYYKKGQRDQSDAADRQVEPLRQISETVDTTSRILLMEQRIKDAIEEYRQKGTPVRVIDSYSDMTDDEKADLFDTVMLRAKGSTPEFNKYRSD